MKTPVAQASTPANNTLPSKAYNRFYQTVLQENVSSAGMLFAFHSYTIRKTISIYQPKQFMMSKVRSLQQKKYDIKKTPITVKIQQHD